MLTDLEKLLKLLDQFNIKESKLEEPEADRFVQLYSPTGTRIVLGSGNGFPGHTIIFEFASTGKFVSFGAWGEES